MREKTFNMRLTPDEWERFERVAKRHEMTVAAVVRMLMKREDDSYGRLAPETEMGAALASLAQAVRARAASKRRAAAAKPKAKKRANG
jgi:uncharacterized membrane protein